ncbi:MAG: outer membrane beta-barrel protein [Alphaproteobacteria bacterium]
MGLRLINGAFMKKYLATLAVSTALMATSYASSNFSGFSLGANIGGSYNNYKKMQLFLNGVEQPEAKSASKWAFLGELTAGYNYIIEGSNWGVGIDFLVGTDPAKVENNKGSVIGQANSSTTITAKRRMYWGLSPKVGFVSGPYYTYLFWGLKQSYFAITAKANTTANTTSEVSKKVSKLVHTLGVGLKYALNQNSGLNFSYGYTFSKKITGTNDIQIGGALPANKREGTPKATFANHELKFGAYYLF